MKPLEPLALSLSALLEHQHLEAATRLLQQQFNQAQTHQQAEQLLGLFESALSDLLQYPSVQKLYLQTLCRARQPQKILLWLEGNSVDQPLRLYQGWALVRLERYTEALEVLHTIEGQTDMDWGVYFRSKGEALFYLGRDDWQGVLEQSRPYLDGAALGRMLLDLGGFLNESGQRPAARVRWAEALAYLQHDPYYLAWAHNSLGYSLINDQPQQAEQHLLDAVRISQKQGAKTFGCKALSGLAAFRRGLGEWERALQGYQQAHKAPGDALDKQLALWGYAHTLRLMGRLEQALGKLTEAVKLNPAEAWMFADIAAAQLMLGEVELAKRSLEQSQNWRERSGRLEIVRRVIRAEMARLGGDSKAAREHLEGLQPQHLWVREELNCFPQLKQLLGQPEPTHTQQYRVQVQTYGMLEVWVNGRAVPINPTGKVGELLVFLMLHGNAASLERLTDRLSRDDIKNKRKALWELVNLLRLALGWRESVQSRRGGYVLDPKAEWVVLEEPQPLNSRELMEGHYSDWILERRPLVF